MRPYFARISAADSPATGMPSASPTAMPSSAPRKLSCPAPDRVLNLYRSKFHRHDPELWIDAYTFTTLDCPGWTTLNARSIHLQPTAEEFERFDARFRSGLGPRLYDAR